MPTYEYLCQKCDQHFEKVQSIMDKPLTVCPEELCGQKKWGRGKVKKLISAGAGLIFKGSGFYITDYRSEKYKEAARKESTAATSSGSEGKTASAGSSGSQGKTTATKKENKSVGESSKSKAPSSK
jgi:putative FmdB family regulatory protein